MKKFGLFIIFLIGVFPVPVSHAQDVEHIQTYDTAISIRADGSIDISEHIEYFFDSPRHGIFRTIPTVKTNDSGKKYVLTLSDETVSDDAGTSYSFTKTKEGENEVLKIGDADRTISGTHIYVITYHVLGALTYFPGHDELFWNVIGDKWQIPIREASATVTLPGAVPRSDLNAKCDICSISYADAGVKFTSTRELASGEGLPVVVGFPKGMVAVLEPKELVPFFATVKGKITLVLLGIAAFLWYILAPILVIRRWWKFGRDPKPAMGEVSAWFSPPKTPKLRDLTPAETGSLVDETVDTKDIYASIVDLARRGYMKIIETRKGVFDFEKQKEGDKGLQPFEKELLNAIFFGKDRVSLKDLDLSSTFEKVKKQIYESLVADGFFPENPQSVRTLYYVLAFFALVTGNLILLIIAMTFGKNMPRKTLFGAQQAAVARSLKHFLVSQDKQLKFQATKQMMFEKLLPYAIAFGVEAVWAARFKDLGLKQPDWYQSSNGGAFNSVIFAQSLGRSAAVSFASSITSKSSSGFSSGFSGGGFSGGGGGGGGGSW